jgi:alpha-glucosidase (family GH31 glycosyl hydrolase)
MYGDLDFDKVTFPDMSNLTQQLHALDFRVTLWVHPFCNIEATCFVPGVENGYWVKNANGEFPGITQWWDGKNAAILDTTNPNATEYFVKRLNFLRIKYYIDGFKFDAGEQKWIPKEFSLWDKKANPNEYSANYVRTAAKNFGILQEARVGARTQDVGIFYRILDRATDWTIQDGIKSVITETLQFGILGYPYVLPDIIFG